VQIPRRFEASAWGGIETVILETSRRLIAAGQQTSILCPNALSPKDVEQLGGVPIRRTPYFYPYFGLHEEAKTELDHRGGNLFSFSLMRELWAMPELDVIHLHTGKRLGGAVRTVARARGIPYVVSLHGGFLEVPREESARYTSPTQGAFEWGRVLGWLGGSRRVLDDAAAVLCVSQAELERLSVRLPKQRLIHFPNGVDTSRFATGDGAAFRDRFGIPRDAFLLTIVGRIDPQKNQLLAVEVLHRLRAQGFDARLALVGANTNQNYADTLDARIQDLGLQAFVTLTGNLGASSNALTDAYHSADLFMLPSVHEPFGIAALEAWASGRAVLASRVGGIPEFVVDGKNGRLFESGDVDQATALALELARDKPQRRALAEAASEDVKQYSWDAVTARLIALYQELCRR
jgi:glycosyltransferase involved in cell wall biosynthesis